MFNEILEVEFGDIGTDGNRVVSNMRFGFYI